MTNGPIKYDKKSPNLGQRRRKYLDDAIDGKKKKKKNPADIKALLSKKRTKKQHRDLRIQLSAAGISATKNTARDKLRLRQIRKGKK